MLCACLLVSVLFLHFRCDICSLFCLLQLILMVFSYMNPQFSAFCSPTMSKVSFFLSPPVNIWHFCSPHSIPFDFSQFVRRIGWFASFGSPLSVLCCHRQTLLVSSSVSHPLSRNNWLSCHSAHVSMNIITTVGLSSEAWVSPMDIQYVLSDWSHLVHTRFINRVRAISLCVVCGRLLLVNCSSFSPGSLSYAARRLSSAVYRGL